jgi:hypothetical protein
MDMSMKNCCKSIARCRNVAGFLRGLPERLLKNVKEGNFFCSPATTAYFWLRKTVASSIFRSPNYSSRIG